ncbi:Hypothetical protein, putative [Bodo saltans]|uniref:Uncharacterized protein n=1 Tax=Bodo saltans TaxID=75058 RepID=A0A0S4JN29_BODSA|nr:Hypothetical protein, putative [Bodo saltans]|eukprot:CUG91566.1 Hypothetical protein, putative [Bodo saltans]
MDTSKLRNATETVYRITGGDDDDERLLAAEVELAVVAEVAPGDGWVEALPRVGRYASPKCKMVG